MLSTPQLSVNEALTDNSSPNPCVICPDGEIETVGGDLSRTVMVLVVLALLESLDVTDSLTVYSPGSDQDRSAVTPLTSLVPSESVSHEKPETGIWSDLFGVSDADMVTDSPTSTESKSLSLEIVGERTGVSVTVTVTAAWEVPAPPPPGPGLLSTTMTRSSPSVSEASHGRYLSLFTRSMSADNILRDEDQSEGGE